MDDLNIELVFRQAVAETYLLIKGDGIASLYRPGIDCPKLTEGNREASAPDIAQAV